MSQIGSIHDYAPGQIGKHIDAFIEEYKGGSEAAYRLWSWRDKRKTLSSGQWEYITMEGSNCWIHYIVNEESIIVAYQAEGDCW